MDLLAVIDLRSGSSSELDKDMFSPIYSMLNQLL